MRIKTVRGDGAVIVETYPMRFSNGQDGFHTEVTVTTDAAHEALGYRGGFDNYCADEDGAIRHHQQTVDRIDKATLRSIS